MHAELISLIAIACFENLGLEFINTGLPAKDDLEQSKCLWLKLKADV